MRGVLRPHGGGRRRAGLGGGPGDRGAVGRCQHPHRLRPARGGCRWARRDGAVARWPGSSRVARAGLRCLDRRPAGYRPTPGAPGAWPDDPVGGRSGPSAPAHRLRLAVSGTRAGRAHGAGGSHRGGRRVHPGADGRGRVAVARTCRAYLGPTHRADLHHLARLPSEHPRRQTADRAVARRAAHRRSRRPRRPGHPHRSTHRPDGGRPAGRRTARRARRVR